MTRNVSQEAQAALAELRVALEKRTVPCPDAKVAHESADDSEVLCPHKEHSYTGRIPDPAFSHLLHVVREECKHPTSEWRYTFGYTISCPACGVESTSSTGRDLPIGYVTRDWTGLPEGALYGALGRAAPGSQDLWGSPNDIDYRAVVILISDLKGLP